MARYLPIAEHGLIGDLHTVALVGTDGTIDWYCCPRFDSPSVFAAILDADHGGLFRISPDCDGWSSKQLYLPDTNILITRFRRCPTSGRCRTSCPAAAARRRTATA
jgi:GH15 family glucan-1,4-alpha-glucosidase